MLEKNSTIVQKYFQSTFKEVSLFEWSHHRFLVTNSTVRTSVHETSSFTLAMKWSSKCVSPRFSKAFRRLCYMPTTQILRSVYRFFSLALLTYMLVFISIFSALFLKICGNRGGKWRPAKKKTNKQINKKQNMPPLTLYIPFVFCFFVCFVFLFF